MKGKLRLVALTLFSALTIADFAFAATDGVYQLIEVTSSATWDGTDVALPQTPTADYDALFGDDASLTYTLPASFSGFTFYSQPYKQITVDTNGNIWFGFTGSAYSISLPSAGKGPVISAWNDDLSSYVSGGIFIQHKPDPERVVVEWQTETFTDEGNTLLNNFEVILFANGTIRIDYKDFPAANGKDSGSGISTGDGTHYLSVTENYSSVHNLAGRYFQFTQVSQLPTNKLSVVFSGTGQGRVTSTPPGIACNTNCSSPFPTGTQVALRPEPSQYSMFTGWTNGVCSGTGDCLLMLNADTTVTTAFERDAARQVQASGAYYSNIQAAYNAIADASTIKLWAINYSEALKFNRPITITLQGGYDSGYSSIVGEPVISGRFTITNGKVIASGLRIK